MTTVDLDKTIDGGSVVRLQVLVFALCTLALMLDGLDSQTLAILGPDIAREWGLTPRALGMVFTSSSVTGAIFGSMLGGSFADRFGRRGIIVVATAFYGLTSGMTATVQNVDQLMFWRALSGIGFGAVLPNAAALLAEYWPARHRAKVVTIAFAGFALGAALGSALSSWLVPAYGWRSVFILGGVAPVLLAGVLWAWLPESVRFLALDPKNGPRLRALMVKLSPETPVGEDVQYLTHSRGYRAGSLRALFRDKLALMTSLVWLISATSLIYLVFTVYWTPTIVNAAGMGFQALVWTNVSMLIGGCAGRITLGLTMDKAGRRFPMMVLFGCGSLVALLGFTLVLGKLGPMAVCAFALGFCVQGFQSGFVGIVSGLYPTEMRATGLGWQSGVGRLASIISPIAGGILVGAGLSPATAYLSSGVLPVITLVALLALWAVVSRLRRAEAEAGIDAALVAEAK